jgi:peptidoglycan/LPS O-acetylase OafA/YrhL
VFGWFVLITDEYKQLGKHIAGGAGFASNFLFLNERGYFDNAAETKPLLHLWSLGVEEQFYIVWPLLLWLAWKLRFNLLILMVAVATISFGLNISSVSNNAVAAFYSPQTRFWELLMGAVLAHMTFNRQHVSAKLEVWFGLAKMSDANRNKLINIQSISGALLIVIAALIITKESSFPGWWALMPTMGTVLIISAGSQAWLNRAVLSSRILVWFGLISYPLYLWHWPLLSFAHIIEADIPSVQLRIGLVLISIALAWLTFGWVEKPIRLGGYSKAKTITLFVLMATVGYVGYNCYERDGLGFRLKDRQAFSEYFENSSPEWKYFKKINLYENYREDCSFFNDKEYRLGSPTEIPRAEISSSCFERNIAYSHAVFVWGDSYAQQLNFGLKKQLPPNWQILQVASSDCRPNVDNAEPSATDFCTQSNWFALKTMSESKPDVVIVAQVIGHNAKEFSHMAEKLKELGVKKIIFAGVAPHWKTDLPKIILNKLWFNTPNRTYQGISAASITNNEKLQQQFQQTETVLFANLLGCFCNQDGCLTYIGDDKKTGITSWDKGHLTPIASDYLAKNLLVDLIVGNNKAK